MFGNELVGLKSAGVKKIGVEVVDKVQCVHYQSTVQGLTVNLWTIPSQRNRTLKVVSDGKAGPQQIPIHLVTVYQNWKWNIHEPATYFKPPAGYKVVEMALPMMPGPPAKK